jgi:hypothetical protein
MRGAHATARQILGDSSMSRQQVADEFADLTIEVEDSLMTLFSFLADSGLSPLKENQILALHMAITMGWEEDVRGWRIRTESPR